jgi:serine/threonine protein phosphatase PrpC
MDASWQSKGTQDTFHATLDEWQRQVIHLGHAWRCYNQKVDDEGLNVDTMTLETTITTCIMALAPAIFRWRKKLPKFYNYSAMAREKHVQARRVRCKSSTIFVAHVGDSRESRLQRHQR